MVLKALSVKALPYKEPVQAKNGSHFFRGFGDLSKCCERGQLEMAIEAAKFCELQGVRISRREAFCLLRGCTKWNSLECSRHVQSLMVRHGLDSVSNLVDHLIRLFAFHGCLLDASKAFERVAEPSEYTWCAFISANAKLGQGRRGLELYHRMDLSNIESNKYVYLAVLKSITVTSALNLGKLIHNHIIKCGIHFNIVIGNTLVDMYAKCGSLKDACEVFDKLPSRDVISWGAIISGYAQHDEICSTIKLFERMQWEGIKPDKYTFSSALKAYGHLGCIDQGRKVHEGIKSSGMVIDIVLGSSLIDMYTKCGNLDEARKIFDMLPNRDIVAWGGMISGYAELGDGLPAIELFKKMQHEGIKPNSIVLSGMLKACGSVGALEQGRLIHEQVMKNMLVSDLVVGTALVDMYAKCGILEEARKIFDDLLCPDVVSWDAMIAGYAHNGDAAMARRCLQDMNEGDIKPGNVTYAGVLVACSRAGLVDEARYHFMCMRKDHEIKPDICHYNCMADVLGRAGFWSEAEDMLQSVSEPNVIGWTSLLSACRMHTNVDLGRRCFDKITPLDPHCIAGYVLMANIYASAHMLEEAFKIERMRRMACAKRLPMVNTETHEYVGSMMCNI